jgi:hypothetical protein
MRFTSWAAESIVHRVQIDPQAVGGQLSLAGESAGDIVHTFMGIAIKAPPSFSRDVDKLPKYTRERLTRMEQLSVPVFRGQN